MALQICKIYDWHIFELKPFFINYKNNLKILNIFYFFNQKLNVYVVEGKIINSFITKS